VVAPRARALAAWAAGNDGATRAAELVEQLAVTEAGGTARRR